MFRSLAPFSLLIFATAAFGQSDRGNITGTVTDPAGAVVANAPIEARNTNTGAIYQAASTDTGNYTLAQLPAGPYELKVSASGFKSYARSGLTVENAQTVRIDVTLQVGDTTESVTVSAAAPLLKTDTGDLSHNVSTDRMDDLPAMGIGAQSASNIGLRNPMAVTQLVPGTYFQSNTSIRVNGAPNNSQAVRLEGLDATADIMSFATTLFQPSIDAVQETAILTSNYAPEYGQSGGGVFNYTMKGGTNSYHGSAYDYFVNEFLNAGTPFTNDGKGHLIRPAQRRNDFGGTLGGPLSIPKLYNGKDRTFFFFNWEQYKEVQYINNQPLVVPTLQMRAGNFSQAGVYTGRTLGTDPLGRPILENTVYDPNTQRPVSATNATLIRDPFPGNTIPASRMDPVALKIQDFIPLPQNGGLINNLIAPWHSPQDTQIPAFKVDQYFGAKNKLSVYWSTMDANSRQPATQLQTVDGIQAINLSNVDGYSGPDVISSSRGNFIQSYTTRVNFDRTVSPTLVWHLGVGYIRFNLSSDPLNINFDTAKYWGLTGAALVRQAPFFSGMQTSFGGMKNMGAALFAFDHEDKSGAATSLTWVKGDHTFKFGGELNVEGFPSEVYSNVAGAFGFSAAQTGLPSTNGQNLGGGNVGFPYASFLLGQVDSVTLNPPEYPKVGRHAIDFYAQDSWKITRKITLDYGLRYDFQTYAREQYGRMPSLSLTTPNTALGGILGAPIYEGSGPGHCNCDFAKNYPYAFGPRLGLAWQVTPKTVVRAGYGIVYGSTAPGSRIQSGAATQSFVLPSGSNGFDQSVMTLANGIPLKSVWPSTSPALFPNIAAINVVDPNAGRPPRQMQWSIGIQREITANTMAEISYVGNAGVWWVANGLVNYNAINSSALVARGLDPRVAANRSLLTSQICSPAAVAAGFTLPYASFPCTATVAQSLRPFPQYGTVSSLFAPDGDTWYNAMHVKVTQRFSHGLVFTSNFVWAKSETLGAAGISPGGAAADGVVNNVFNRPVNKLLSAFDQPFAWVTAVNYTVPTWKAGTGATKALSWVAGYWTFGALLSYASGLPILAPASNNSLNSVLFQSTYQNRVPGVPLFTVPDINCHCYDPSATFVLNPKAWTDAAPGTFGTAAPYYSDYRYQRRPGENMSISRQFRIAERVSLNIRAEFNNIFNRATPPDPVATNAQATQVRAANGNTVSGFGFINTAAVAGGISGLSGPRNGTIVARFVF
ncbi:MAG TPA: TonB-dependent receptor [Bryobacteraceae bacterium]|nr:TonB-dependent receptor [Bryobacteraceae bacterium]